MNEVALEKEGGGEGGFVRSNMFKAKAEKEVSVASGGGWTLEQDGWDLLGTIT